MPGSSTGRNARRADRRARPDRRRPRPLHDQLAPGREGPREAELGECGCGSEGLSEHGISPVVTLYGAPRWANGGRAPNWAPKSGATFAAFAAAAANRYPWVKLWLVWNEPNQRRWLRPTTPQTYVTKLLNPAYAAIHNATPDAKVGGGVTAPRASTGGVSPGRLDPGHGRRGGAPRRVRAQPVSAQPPGDALDRRLRALRDDHDVDDRAVAARVLARLRLAHTDLADRVRLSDEPAGSCSRRLQDAPGPLRETRRHIARSPHETSTCSFSTSTRTSPRSGAGRAVTSPLGEAEALIPCCAASSRAGFPRRRLGRCCGGRYGRATGGGATCSSSSETAAGDPLAGSERRTRTDS